MMYQMYPVLEDNLIIPEGDVLNSMGRNGKEKANISGAEFERKISNVLKGYKFHVVKHKEIINGFGLDEFGQSWPDRLLRRDVPFKGAMAFTAEANGRKKACGKTEFVLYANDARATEEFQLDAQGKLSIRIECKYQDSSGSAAEKIPFAVDNLMSAPEDNVLIVVGGDNIDINMIDFCKRKISKYKENLDSIPYPPKKPKTFHIMTFEEYVDWCNRAFGVSQ